MSSNWNKPTTSDRPLKSGHGKVSYAKGIFAALVVVVCVGAFLLWLARGRSERDESQRNRNNGIKVVAPAVSTNAAPKKHVGKWSPKLKPERTAGVKQPEQVARDVLPIGKAPGDRYFQRKLFKARSDNAIAELLKATPGDMVIGGIKINKHFDDEFKASLNDKIEILPEDTEEDAAVKKAVMTAKDQLKACMEKGESPRDIMQAAFDDMYKVWEYRDKLEQNVKTIVREGGTLEEARGYVAEANEMLKEYGAKPIKLHPRTVKKLQQRAAENGQMQNVIKTSQPNEAAASEVKE